MDSKASCRRAKRTETILGSVVSFEKKIETVTFFDTSTLRAVCPGLVAFDKLNCCREKFGQRDIFYSNLDTLSFTR